MGDRRNFALRDKEGNEISTFSGKSTREDCRFNVIAQHLRPGR
jgi:hypothetical protein